MRTAGIHLQRPPSPVTAANQKQRLELQCGQRETMVMIGLHQGETTNLMTKDRTDMKFRCIKESLQGQRVESEMLGW